MKVLAWLLTSAALPFGALCFRLSGESEPPGANESFKNPCKPEAVATNRAVPTVTTYRRVWTSRYTSERHLQEPLPSSIKLILGVFTVAQDTEYRQVVRQTWLQQAGACYWNDGPRDDCSVYVAFVIGRNGSGSKKVNVTEKEVERAHKEEGMLVLDIVENMDEGKALTWFRIAHSQFPWATHIAKMDMDTYPFLHKLVNRMANNRSCVEATGPYEFIGRPQTNGHRNFTEHCPYEPCHGHFLSKADDRSLVAGLFGDWTFLNGEIYIMSLPLAKLLPWAQGRRGAEDVDMSQAVNEVAKEHNFCVTLRRLDAWFHNNQWVDAAYSNDF